MALVRSQSWLWDPTIVDRREVHWTLVLESGSAVHAVLVQRRKDVKRANPDKIFKFYEFWRYTTVHAKETFVYNGSEGECVERL